MNRFWILLLLLIAVTCGGCMADKKVAIYNLGAESGFGLFGDLVGGGCIVEVNGDPTNLYIKYKDEKCDVQFGQEPLVPPPDTGDI